MKRVNSIIKGPDDINCLEFKVRPQCVCVCVCVCVCLSIFSYFSISEATGWDFSREVGQGKSCKGSEGEYKGI